jgi:hypothetical protein
VRRPLTKRGVWLIESSTLMLVLNLSSIVAVPVALLLREKGAVKRDRLSSPISRAERRTPREPARSREQKHRRLLSRTEPVTGKQTASRAKGSARPPSRANIR